ncbi:MAG TPA: type IV toxin-antitoxin system AbiEi family antitoxin domain-containing protein [Solirubrobacterales bacterium]|nr:type IV toxin-antitoxin system AbiEi family antitoxin domain-containing protein [Solirubrobacterales bacterium]
MPAESAKDRRIGDFTRTRRGRARESGTDSKIGQLADRQHGVVSWRQLVDLGLGKDAIQHRISAGRLRPLHRGVYAVGHRVVPREGEWLAAVLVSGEEAALSHWSAAALWMIRPNSRSRIDVTVSHRSRSNDLIRRHISQVPADERTVKEGIPVTSVPRTTFDLAASEDVDTVVAMLREAEHRNLWDRLSLWDLLDRYPGRRGSRKVRLALERLKEEPVGRKRSKLEERFAPFLRHHRLPLPRFNDWIDLGSKRYQVDCHWPDVREIVELDGWEGHGTRSAFRDDRARDRRLRVAGYSITRITWAQLDDEPEAVASDLEALLYKRP